MRQHCQPNQSRSSSLRRGVLLGLWVLGITLLGAASADAASFLYPVSGRLTSTYYSSRPYGYHRALDIAAPMGARLNAARAGRVTYAGVRGGYGKLVILEHTAGYTTYYAHQSRIAVRVGQRVSTGQQIGYIGSSGNSTGPHVHFEIRRYGSKKYLPGAHNGRVTGGRGVAQNYTGLSATSGGSNSGDTGSGNTASGNTGSGSTGSGNTDSGAAGTTATPPSTSTAVQVVRVTASGLNVRTGPGSRNRRIGAIRWGQKYVSIGRSGSWHKIWFDGRTGWAHGSYLLRTTGEIRTVTARALNVRTGPSSRYSRVGSVPRNSRFVRNGSSGRWLRINYGGKTRWFHSGYTRR